MGSAAFKTPCVHLSERAKVIKEKAQLEQQVQTLREHKKESTTCQK